ncbi:conserved hypothetical protein [Gloeothece citriformis PCC 7424]|uniref:Uncharacterized protein n=1 Tax=Gloeothece citriformis (strain PCC 7424) TaxID=65393 RepID=B7KGA9_GLOC7|nr:hypothetical protein [Gloeothece citriformis]ACK70580.1 conserved hypothetical protein [Gloeothece citriformis PCC 7424]
MSDPPIDLTLYWLLTFHCFLGGLGATIAWRKGRNLPFWLILGLIAGTAVFFVALLMKPKK